jgi:hypothetical protein
MQTPAFFTQDCIGAVQYANAVPESHVVTFMAYLGEILDFE